MYSENVAASNFYSTANAFFEGFSWSFCLSRTMVNTNIPLCAYCKFFISKTFFFPLFLLESWKTMWVGFLCIFLVWVFISKMEKAGLEHVCTFLYYCVGCFAESDGSKRLFCFSRSVSFYSFASSSSSYSPAFLFLIPISPCVHTFNSFFCNSILLLHSLDLPCAQSASCIFGFLP